MQVQVEFLQRLFTSSSSWILLFSVLYFPPTIFLAKSKLLWDDEFFTLYLSRITSWRELLTALATGADQHPPLFYVWAHLSMYMFGPSPFTLRLPEILGFWVFCACLFFIAKPITGIAWAAFATLFPLTTHTYYYATEARGYGLVLGFSALALLCWIRATEDHRRKLYIPLLGISLMGAVSSHYYAVCVAATILLGELIRTCERRKIDWAITSAIASTAIPLILFAPTIRRAKGYSAHFWAVPHWGNSLRFYAGEYATGVLGILGPLAILLLARRRWPTHSRDDVQLRRYEVVVLFALALLPFLVMLLAKGVTHGYTARYAIATVIGCTLLLTYLLAKLAPGQMSGAFATTLCVAVFAYQIIHLRSDFQASQRKLDEDFGVLMHYDSERVAVINITSFHQLSFYAKRDLASRLYYVADPESAVRDMGHDTIDRGLLDLRPWFPLRVVKTQLFLAGNKTFLVYGESGAWSWLTFEIPKWGDTRLLLRSDSSNLFRVEVSNPEAFQSEDDSAMNKNSLYLTLGPASLSLCEQYMKPGVCPSLKEIKYTPTL